MNVVVVNGTEVRGCTYRLKEIFLSGLRGDNKVFEFYLPRDLPHFCRGCKACFTKSEELCPHAGYVQPIWQAMLEAELIVFAFPVYALRAPSQLKALLDHLCVHWMVHRPEERMFAKHAVLLTNSIGAPNGSAQKDVLTSLNWLGVSSVHRLGFGLMEGVIWEEISEKRRGKMERKVLRMARRCKDLRPAATGLKVRLYFAMCRMMHGGLLKKDGENVSADNQHWLDKGWLKVEGK